MPKSKPPSPHSRRACKKAFPSAQFGAKRYALRWVTAATDGWSSELRFRLVGKSVGLKNGAALNLPRPMQLVPDGVWEICQVRRRSDKSFMCQFQHLASPPIPSIRIQPSRPAAAEVGERCSRDSCKIYPCIMDFRSVIITGLVKDRDNVVLNLIKSVSKVRALLARHCWR